MTVPVNHSSIAFGHFSTIRPSAPSLAKVILPPKGGLLAMNKPVTLPFMNIAISSAERGGALYRFAPTARFWRAAPTLSLLVGCDGAPSRNILGSYFPSWMVCALVGIALALAARAIFKASGILEELPVPFVVMLAIACASTFAMWLIWLA
jgi:hypothetical protein